MKRYQIEMSLAQSNLWVSVQRPKSDCKIPKIPPSLISPPPIISPLSFNVKHPPIILPLIIAPWVHIIGNVWPLHGKFEVVLSIKPAMLLKMSVLYRRKTKASDETLPLSLPLPGGFFSEFLRCSRGRGSYVKQNTANQFVKEFKLTESVASRRLGGISDKLPLPCRAACCARHTYPQRNQCCLSQKRRGGLWRYQVVGTNRRFLPSSWVRSPLIWASTRNSLLYSTDRPNPWSMLTSSLLRTAWWIAMPTANCRGISRLDFMISDFLFSIWRLVRQAETVLWTSAIDRLCTSWFFSSVESVGFGPIMIHRKKQYSSSG